MTSAVVAHAPVALQLTRGGGDAFIVEHGGDFVTLASTAPSPPGSTVEATHAGAARSIRCPTAAKAFVSRVASSV